MIIDGCVGGYRYGWMCSSLSEKVVSEQALVLHKAAIS